jgi:hypothetical protein
MAGSWIFTAAVGACVILVILFAALVHIASDHRPRHQTPPRPTTGPAVLTAHRCAFRDAEVRQARKANRHDREVDRLLSDFYNGR